MWLQLLLSTATSDQIAMQRSHLLNILVDQKVICLSTKVKLLCGFYYIQNIPKFNLSTLTICLNILIVCNIIYLVNWKLDSQQTYVIPGGGGGARGEGRGSVVHPPPPSHTHRVFPAKKCHLKKFWPTLKILTNPLLNFLLYK